MVIIPNYLDSQVTLVIVNDLCYFIAPATQQVDNRFRFKFSLLLKHQRWVSEVLKSC